MKRAVQKRDRDSVLATHPIADRLDGWFFRVEEVCQGGDFRAAGVDLWGREVSAFAKDFESALKDAMATAARIQSEIDRVE